MSTLTAATLGGIALSFLCSAALAERTTYPLTIENCGKEVTFEKAPERTVALGQNSAEILLLLGLEDRMDEQGLIREVTGQGRYRMWRIVEPRSTEANSMPERHDELLAEDFFDVLAALQ